MGRGNTPLNFPENETNNSVAGRGAPKGNRNALKHGMETRERREFHVQLRAFMRRIDAVCDVASAIARPDRAP